MQIVFRNETNSFNFQDGLENLIATVQVVETC